MFGKSQINGGRPAMLRAGSGMSVSSIVVIAVALIAVWAFAEHGRVAQAQAESSCEAINLGTLSAETDSVLEMDGRWTTEDCDSRFRTDSDAHTYRFEVEEEGRVRIDLTSTEGDPYLYLMAEDGTRMTDNDDGGAGSDARVEQNLAAGVYLVEATTLGGRKRGEADFTLSVGRVSGCETIHLGTLSADAALTATGSWTIDTCGSRFVVEHPAYSYSFNLPEGGRVLIDLTSTDADTVLSLASASDGLIAANDDGGERGNSHIKRYLPAGTYVVEATTYLERNYQPLVADFTLVVSLVDEETELQSFLLKVEATHAPDEVIAGLPFPVHYRIGNLGNGDLADVGGTAEVYIVGPRVYGAAGPISASGGRWRGGVSYHTGTETANATSVSIDRVKPFEVTLRRPGPSWVFVAIVTYDAADNEVGFQGIWRNLMVLSGVELDKTTVEVDRAEYEVSAEADADGMVTVSVNATADPDAEVDAATRAKATYAAGVHTQLLNGIFERSAIAGLPTTAKAEPVSVADPWSETLLETFADEYMDAVTKIGLDDHMEAGEAIDPMAVEWLLTRTAATASSQYASLAASWKTLQTRINDGGSLSVEEAFAVQSGLAYAEHVLSPMMKGGEIVRAARTADLRWEDPQVQAMSDELAYQASCRRGAAALPAALEAAGVTDIDQLLDLDAEMRVALPIYGLVTDSILCAAATSDSEVSQFLESLSIADSEEILLLFGIKSEPVTTRPGPAEAPTHRLRIIARLGEDDRVELGAELADGERILPSVRYLPDDSPVDTWRISSDVEVDGNPIGKIRVRRLADGRFELGFLTSDGETISPDIRYVPTNVSTGVWLRSSEIEAPIVEALE